MNRSDFEIMSPVGSWESLAAAFQAGAGSVYFGVDKLNMRARSASKFTIDDLREIARLCSGHGVKSYLTLNTVMYGEDLPMMRMIADAALEAGISAVIACDVAVMTYCNSIGLEVHLSTQLNISNIEALRFYARFADVVVLARELNLDQVAEISRRIEEEDIRGPKGDPVRIEMFCHGALCMAISGKCYMSLDLLGASANRGACMQVCRRGYNAYLLRDRESDLELSVENQYLMSPKDLKTIRFIDRMIEAGVRVFKIEGRARGADYVRTVTECYSEAIGAVMDGNFTEERKDEWDRRLATVFNRGFWDGWYLGQKLGEWNDRYGSQATETKVYVGRCTDYFAKLGVGEFLPEAAPLTEGDRLMVTGNATGCLTFNLEGPRVDLKPVREVPQNTPVSFRTPEKVRRGDKLYKLVPREGQEGQS